MFRTLVLASLAIGGCDRPSVTVKTETPSVPAAWPHRLNAPDVAAPRGIVVSDSPLASRVERRGEWHGMADPRLHGESTGY